jgi:hypothetical protein
MHDPKVKDDKHKNDGADFQNDVNSLFGDEEEDDAPTDDDDGEG